MRSLVCGELFRTIVIKVEKCLFGRAGQSSQFLSLLQKLFKRDTEDMDIGENSTAGFTISIQKRGEQ